MTLNVQILSKEIIKPSSPTPPHLRVFSLSLLDQHQPLVHVPIILFYTATDYDKVNGEGRLDCLKKSLSETLSHLYPLAGRLNNNDIIDCNDEGVNFYVSHVNGDLLDVINNPIGSECCQLLPSDNFRVLGQVLLSIQMNIFDCGGMTLGVCISHKVADVSSLTAFVNVWAAVARGDKDFLRPQCSILSLFPPKTGTPLDSCTTDSPILEKVVNKRFVFNASNLALLKAKCSKNLYNPTRVEAVCALLWMCAIRNRSSERLKLASKAMVAVNLRKRMVPPLSDHIFGNFSILTPAAAPIKSSEDLPALGYQLREALVKVNEEQVRELLTDDGFSTFVHSSSKVNEAFAKGELDIYKVSSWCRFPFYKIDFGWGKPTWASANIPYKNVFVLMDTKCGNGVEAWVSLEEKDMARFECDPSLIAFTSNHEMEKFFCSPPFCSPCSPLH